MGFVNLANWDPFQNLQGRGRGHGKAAMCTVDPAMAVMQGRHEYFLDAKRLDAHASADNIRDGIQRANFVEMHIVHRLPMNFALRLGNASKNGQRALLDERRQLAVFDHFADVPVTAFVIVVMMMLMRRAVMFVVLRRVVVLLVSMLVRV